MWPGESVCAMEGLLLLPVQQACRAQEVMHSISNTIFEMQMNIPVLDVGCSGAVCSCKPMRLLSADTHSVR